MAPADAAEPAALGEPSRTTSVGSLRRRRGHGGPMAWSSVDLLEGAVRRKPTIETSATIRKMKTEIAAANPYWAPPPPKASR